MISCDGVAIWRTVRPLAEMHLRKIIALFRTMGKNKIIGNENNKNIGNGYSLCLLRDDRGFIVGRGINSKFGNEIFLFLFLVKVIDFGAAK